LTKIKPDTQNSGRLSARHQPLPSGQAIICRRFVMSDQSRFMLVVSPLMENSPAFDRAAALAKASGAALHIVAFDYLEGLATAGMVNEQAREQMRLGYVERHRQWLEDQARPCARSVCTSPRKSSGSKGPCRKSSFISKNSRWPY
jgi:hypothetical protein